MTVALCATRAPRQTSRTRSFVKSRGRGMLSIAKLNIASSRVHAPRSRRIRMAQMSSILSGHFFPVSLSLLHGTHAAAVLTVASMKTLLSSEGKFSPYQLPSGDNRPPSMAGARPENSRSEKAAVGLKRSAGGRSSVRTGLSTDRATFSGVGRRPSRLLVRVIPVRIAHRQKFFREGRKERVGIIDEAAQQRGGSCLKVRP